jgi:hypothetical protein
MQLLALKAATRRQSIARGVSPWYQWHNERKPQRGGSRMASALSPRWGYGASITTEPGADAPGY